MENFNRIAFIFGIVLLVFLVCPTITAYDDQAVQYYNEGVEFAKLGQFTEAVASYDKALAINPDYAEAWKSRGKALGNLDRVSEALTSFDKLIYQTRLRRGMVRTGGSLYFLGRYSDAIASYDKAIAINQSAEVVEQPRTRSI